MQCEPGSTSGQNAETLVKYDDLRIVLIALKAHARIPGHQAEARISVHTHQRLPHDFEALEDSALLPTTAWPGRDGDRAG